jgi:branched-chain amino acid transport system permease protein
MLEQIGLAIISGLGVGSMYGLTALGYHVTYRVSKTVNFAQGTCLMLAAVLGFTFQVTWHCPALLSVLFSLVLCGFWSLLVERVAVRPFVKVNSDAWLMSTLALGLVLENGVLFVFGKDPRGMPSAWQEIYFVLMGLRVSALQALIPLVGILIAVGLGWTLKKTKYGKSLLAVSLNLDASKIMGINSQRVIAMSYALSGVLAGVAGLMIAPIYTVSAGMGTLFGIKAFAVAILGGLDSAVGVMVAGVLMGLLEALIITVFGSTYAQMFSFGITIVALCIKPNGLFGRVAIKKI